MAFESELGAQAPLGFWDPLNVLDYCDQERFERLRYVEVSVIVILYNLHHCVVCPRVCMSSWGDLLPNMLYMWCTSFLFALYYFLGMGIDRKQPSFTFIR